MTNDNKCNLSRFWLLVLSSLLKNKTKQESRDEFQKGLDCPLKSIIFVHYQYGLTKVICIHFPQFIALAKHSHH